MASANVLPGVVRRPFNPRSGAGSTWTTPNVVATALGSTSTGFGRIRSLTLNQGAVANLPAGVSYAAGATDGLTLSTATYSPGFSARSVSGTNIQFADSSTLIMEIGGPMPGLGHDKITDGGRNTPAAGGHNARVGPTTSLEAGTRLSARPSA